MSCVDEMIETKAYYKSKAYFFIIIIIMINQAASYSALYAICRWVCLCVSFVIVSAWFICRATLQYNIQLVYSDFDSSAQHHRSIVYVVYVFRRSNL